MIINQQLKVFRGAISASSRPCPYQDSARSGADLVATRKDLRRSEQETEKVGKVRDELQARVIQLEASVATLTERLQQISTSRDELWRLLQDRAKEGSVQNDAAPQPQEGKEAPAN